MNKRKMVTALAIMIVAGALPASSDAASAPLSVVQAMAKADAYWLAHGVSETGATWQNSTFHVGNLADLRTSGATPNTATQTWAMNNHYTVNSSTGSARPDDLAAGEVYLTLGQPASIRARLASEVAAGNYTSWSYVDALNMAMPAYARLGMLDRSAADLSAMQAQFNYTEKTLGLFDEATGLWWRDARYKGTSTYWSRGNGWAIMALAKVLQILPSTDPRYGEYLRVFKKMAAALIPRQLSDGFWGADLKNPSAYGYEESGTAFFTYAIAWGINAGILDPTVYRPVVVNAWTTLSTIAVQPSGEVGYVQGATTGAAQPSDGQPVKVTDTSAYGVGGFLLAGSEMAPILSSGNPPANTTPPNVTGRPQQSQTLRTDNGTWTGSPTRYSYAWQDCDSSRANCTTISGATSSSYTLQASDVGHAIRSEVTATNAGGSTTASSQPTAVVSAGAGGSTFALTAPASPAALRTPEPAVAHNAGLSAVTCPSDAWCVAVGSYQNRRDHRLGLIESWNGARWTIMRSAPLPGHKPVFLSGVSCASPRACMTVGVRSQNSPQTGSQPVSERWDGSHWQTVRVPVPRHTTIESLSSVSCTSAANCTAVGTVVTIANRTQAIIDHYNGRGWRIVDTQSAGRSELNRVSCSTATSCVAVGGRHLTRRGESPLILRSNGTTWQPIPLASSGFATLLGVSCLESTACLIVGGHDFKPIDEQLTGRQLAAAPSAAADPPSPIVLSDISCPTATRCLALGTEGRTSRSNGKAIAEIWDGAAFTTAFTAPHAGISPYAATACRPAFCLIVGNHAGRVQSERYAFATATN